MSNPLEFNPLEEFGGTTNAKVYTRSSYDMDSMSQQMLEQLGETTGADTHLDRAEQMQKLMQSMQNGDAELTQ